MRSLATALVGTLCSFVVLNAFSFGQTSGVDTQGAQPRSVSVGDEEVREHLVGNPPLFRMNLSNADAAILMEGVPVHVTVDSNGAVTSATADESVPPDLQRPAEAAAKGTQYRPFERDGRAVPVTFESRVIVLPPEVVPKTRVPFPTVHNWDSVRITLSRTTCLGTCPSYRVEISGNGTIVYEGRAYVSITGRHHGSMPKEAVVQLVNEFRDADYYSLQDEYVWRVTDMPTYETSIEIDGRLKKVKDYAGLQIGMPLTISKLEADIDRLADTERWTNGNENTVNSLTEEKWDFKTPEAAETLARITQSGKPEAVQDLLAAGVPLEVNSEVTVTTLSHAAYRGDMLMLRALVSAGAVKNTRAMDAALFAAASGGNPEAVRFLIAHGARLQSADGSGRTLLMAAAGSGVPAVVEQVLSFNPDVNARGTEGRTALMEAVGHWHYGPEKGEINRAEVTRLLLERGADPNLKDERGNTALIECAWDSDAALLLIQHRADVNAQNNDGLTALINTPEPDVVRVLIENGADPYLRDKEGRSALDQAKQYGMKEKAAAIEAALARKQ